MKTKRKDVKDCPPHPGEVLLSDHLKPRAIPQTRLAEHLGWPQPKINEIVRGKRGITPATALAFADSFGTTPEYWLELQNAWDLWQAEKVHEKVSEIS